MDPSKLPLKYNRHNIDRKLSFEYRLTQTMDYQLYVHSPDDLPYFNEDKVVLLNRHRVFAYSVRFKTLCIRDKDLGLITSIR